ncbi:MAG: hypothetical protein R2848_00935 [Thermomicrobiales bacterium]
MTRYRIGELAMHRVRRCAQRHYDQIGLLRPTALHQRALATRRCRGGGCRFVVAVARVLLEQTGACSTDEAVIAEVSAGNWTVDRELASCNGCVDVAYGPDIRVVGFRSISTT